MPRKPAAPRITEAESRIMAVLWGLGAVGADRILAETAKDAGWGEATVRTLISRLIKKGAAVSERREGRVVYAPTISREAYLTAEGQGLLDRLFGGGLTPMVAHFTRTKALSAEDRARLRRLLAELDAEED